MKKTFTLLFLFTVLISTNLKSQNYSTLPNYIADEDARFIVFIQTGIYMNGKLNQGSIIAALRGDRPEKSKVSGIDVSNEEEYTLTPDFHGASEELNKFLIDAYTKEFEKIGMKPEAIVPINKIDHCFEKYQKKTLQALHKAKPHYIITIIISGHIDRFEKAIKKNTLSASSFREGVVLINTLEDYDKSFKYSYKWKNSIENSLKELSLNRERILKEEDNYKLDTNSIHYDFLNEEQISLYLDRKETKYTYPQKTLLMNDTLFVILPKTIDFVIKKIKKSFKRKYPYKVRFISPEETNAFLTTHTKGFLLYPQERYRVIEKTKVRKNNQGVETSRSTSNQLELGSIYVLKDLSTGIVYCGPKSKSIIDNWRINHSQCSRELLRKMKRTYHW